MWLLSRKRLSLLLLLAVLGAMAVVVWKANVAPRPAAAAVNALAPDFVLKDVDGKEIRLSDYRGRGVVVHFWATYCAPCVREMPLLQEAYQKAGGVGVIGVNVGQSRGTVTSFAESKGLSFPLLIDASGRLSELYRVQALPTTVLVNAKGRIVRIVTGEMGNEAQLAQRLKEIH